MLSSDLRDKALQFVETSITLSQLEEWLVPRLPFFLRTPDSVDANVVAAIELGLAEVSSGIRTQDEFRDYLKDVLRENSAISAFYPADLSQRIESGSANRTENVGYSIFGREVTISVT